MISTLLFKLSSFCRCRIINGPDEKPYLERYHLLRLPFGYRVYLHRFVASDPGRGLHNHPWNHAVSWVLSGYYSEVRMKGPRENYRLKTRRVSAGGFNLIGGSVFHRINVDEGKECWSLFMHGPRAKDWGFLRGPDYLRHEQVVGTQSNPQWWKNANRPVSYPDMRQPRTAS